MLDRTEAAYIAVDRNVVGWVGEYEIGAGFLHEPIEIAGASRIATKKAVAPESPKVPLSSDWRPRLRRNDVLWCIGTGGIGITRLIENEVDLCEAEASQLDLEIK